MSASAQSLSGTVVGDYLVGHQIGSGSFSVVWHGRHRVHNTEVAIKEIATSRLSKKLKDSLMSEIFILKRINHPNIICLHDIIEVPGRINIVLEYCKGGDLSMYLQRRGKVPESIARNFMKQLAAGLQVLRDNNLIHRDLKPQNLLLSTKSNDSVLKIADFGFARPLQPRGLAETLCGSPLYMAPEIMQLQKYDAKADLWSVGAILYQLITGKTPYTGSNQIQLLQNILKSNELKFPPDCGDLSSECKDLCQKLLRRNPVERLTFDEFFNHPFISQRKMDDPMRGTWSSNFHEYLGMAESTHAEDAEENAAEDCLPFILDDVKKEADVVRKAADDFLKAGSSEMYNERGDKKLSIPRSKVMESTEMVDGYVIVSSPPPQEASWSPSSSRGKWRKSRKEKSVLSTGEAGRVEMESGRFGTESVEDRALDGMGRIKCLEESASALGSLVQEKMAGEKQVEAFSIQLVILAIWKQALSICHAWAASKESMGASWSEEAIEREFLREVEYAEELARGIEPGGSEMPDAMEIIFQCALALGRNGGVDELMGNGDSARLQYHRAANLLRFLLEDGPSLILNPPFSLTTSDRYRLKTYIHILTNRRFNFPEASPP